MKIVSYIFESVLNVILALYVGVLELIRITTKGITGRSHVKRFGVIFSYSAFILTAIFEQKIFLIMAGITLLSMIAFGLMVIKEDSTQDTYYQEYKNDSSASKGELMRNIPEMKNDQSDYSDPSYEVGSTVRQGENIFEGLSLSDAENEYERLMKLYHPQKGEGDFIKMQEVVISYSNYCRANGQQ
mgnify:CR=1 FL=1